MRPGLVRSPCIVALAAALTFLAPAAAFSLEAPDGAGEELLEQAWRMVRERFWDRDADVDWDALLARYRERARAARTPAELHGVVNAMLGELRTSHLVVVEGDVYERILQSEFQDRPEPMLGLACTILEEGVFVSQVLEGGPAARAGIRTGDRLLRIDGEEPLASPRARDSGHDPGLDGPPGIFIMADEGEGVVLDLERYPRAGGRYSAVVRCERWNMILSARHSVRLIEHGRRRLGYVRLHHYMNGRMVSVLEDALRGPLAQADGLVLDVRGRGGHPQIISEVLDLFRRRRGREPLWTRPTVCLIDRDTRSAKEIFAWYWRRQEIGRLVGETTRGAVIGAQFFPLADGSVIMIPAMDVSSFTAGEQLEGRGIDPDVAVDSGPLPYSDGRDAILDAGVQELIVELGAARRRARAGAWY